MVNLITHSFYLKGWRGINIEPNPDKIELFQKIRTRDINLNLGISDQETELIYYKYPCETTTRFLPPNEKENLSVIGEKPISSNQISVKKIGGYIARIFTTRNNYRFLVY